MTPTRRALLVALVGWTAFVWGTRIANAWRSTTESTAAKLSSTVVAMIFLALAAAVGVVLVRSRHRTRLERPEALALAALAVWTVAVWSVRLVAIVAADHSIGFVVVHAVLAGVSVALAVPAWQTARAGWSTPVAAG